MKTKPGPKGFTLIELLVVLAILGMLAALVGPAIFSNLGKGQRATAASQVSNLETALDTYLLEIGRYPETLEGLVELFQIRESLEGMACRLAAQRMSRAELDELRRVLETHEKDEAFQAGRGYYQQEGDYDFHYKIIQASGNQILTRILCGELYQLARMYRIQYSAAPNRPRQAFAEHHRILDALADGDGELADLLMRRHIGASRRNIEQQIAQGASGGANSRRDQA
jgi:type II secretion system protein G